MLVKKVPHFIEPFFQHFYLFDGDDMDVCNLKLSILGFILPKYDQIIDEIQIYVSGDSIDVILKIVQVFFDC